MARPTGRAPRFFAPSLAGGLIELPDFEAHHALKVLRLGVGDRVELFDGVGGLIEATLETAGRNQVICREQAVLETAGGGGGSGGSLPGVVVAAAIPKGDAAAQMVDMLSQVGAALWLPMLTERSVALARGEKKLQKFERIAIESAKQSGRLHLMRIGEVTRFEQVLKHPTDVRRILTPPPPPEVEPEVAATAKNELSGAGVPGGPGLPGAGVLLLVGPEGGFTEAEVAAALAAGFEPWTVGRHVMRIETAAVVAAALAGVV